MKFDNVKIPRLPFSWGGGGKKFPNVIVVGKSHSSLYMESSSRFPNSTPQSAPDPPTFTTEVFCQTRAVFFLLYQCMRTFTFERSIQAAFQCVFAVLLFQYLCAVSCNRTAKQTLQQKGEYFICLRCVVQTKPPDTEHSNAKWYQIVILDKSTSGMNQQYRQAM